MSWCFLGYSSCKDWLDLELYAAPGFFWVFERIEMAVSCRDGRRLFQVEDKIDVDLMPASLTLFWLETWILAICIRITMLWLVHAWLTGCYNHWCLYFMDKCSYQPKPCSVQLQVNTWSFLNNGWNVWSWRHNFPSGCVRRQVTWDLERGQNFTPCHISGTSCSLLARNFWIYQSKSAIFAVKRFELHWLRSVLHFLQGLFSLLEVSLVLMMNM